MNNNLRIINSIQEMQELAYSLRQQGKSIGFVPTMGYLHQGHISLMQAAREENDSLIASIFVNPAQFGPHEDFSRYPRDIQSDSRLAGLAGVDILFCPETADMYPPDFISYVEPENLGERLCGHSRPGHFRGVCTVVLKLFNIVCPHRAYFGQKDAQQYLILRRMTLDLNLPIEIKRLPIVREPDGLAMSSRNVYLNPEERQQALALSRALNGAKVLYGQGERRADVLKQAIGAELASATLGRVDYAEIVDIDNLLPIDVLDKAALVALAVYFGRTRLIDNIILGDE